MKLDGARSSENSATEEQIYERISLFYFRLEKKTRFVPQIHCIFVCILRFSNVEQRYCHKQLPTTSNLHEMYFYVYFFSSFLLLLSSACKFYFSKFSMALIFKCILMLIFVEFHSQNIRQIVL